MTDDAILKAVQLSSFGEVTTTFGGPSVGRSILQQANGKILVAGTVYSYETNVDFALARYNADGGLDTSFNGDGKVTTDITNWVDDAKDMLLQSDRKILVLGGGGGVFIVDRYDVNGNLDSTFSNDGKETISFYGSNNTWGWASFSGATLQDDGKILLVGTFRGDVALARLCTDGRLDNTFDQDGRLLTDFGAMYGDEGLDVAIQNDGRILVLGKGNSIALARYNADGSLDLNFGDKGKVISLFDKYYTGYELKIQDNGKILISGCGSEGSQDFLLIRLNSDGSLDTTFGDNGKVLTNIGSSDLARCMALQSDGNTIIAGTDGQHAILIRYARDGYLDASFGAKGIVSIDFATSINSIDIQKDGKIIATGERGGLFTVVRINKDGSLDTTFNQLENVNRIPSGDVGIKGDATQGYVLTVDDTLDDINGMGSVNYQWKTNGKDIKGANGVAYSLSQNDVGQHISVRASYVDNLGKLEVIESVATSLIKNKNDFPTGFVSITGLASEGQMLTASNSLDDVDGLGTITYQWLRNGQEISGANSESYQVSLSDITHLLSVEARYTDGFGTTESVLSTNGLTILPQATINSQSVDAKGNLAGTANADVFDGAKTPTATLVGGQGDDSYLINSSATQIKEVAKQGFDIVFSSVSFSLPSNVEKLILTGDANIDAKGNTLDNVLAGNYSNNILFGFSGNDTLTGGAGKDTFVFSTALNAKTNVDNITDFNPGEDLIGLKASIFKKLGVGVEASELWLKNQGSVQTAKQYLIYDSNSGTLSYDADGSGKGVAIPVAIIGTNLSLVAGDFVVLQ
jgi:uncharacterized delta-60 repeat protein